LRFSRQDRESSLLCRCDHGIDLLPFLLISLLDLQPLLLHRER
jgi:hypothetical protein